MDTGYSIHTYANGYGVWCARITFPNGAGNTGAGERLIANALAAARRAIRRELIARGNGSTLPALRYELIANSSYGSGALSSLTLAETGVR